MLQRDTEERLTLARLLFDRRGTHQKHRPHRRVTQNETPCSSLADHPCSVLRGFLDYWFGVRAIHHHIYRVLQREARLGSV